MTGSSLASMYLELHPPPPSVCAIDAQHDEKNRNNQGLLV